MTSTPRAKLPPRLLPVLYFGTAHVALALAFGAAALDPRGVSGFFYHSRMLGIVHLVTLGWITASILESLYPNHAMLMIDYPSGRDFTLPGTTSPTAITRAEVLHALSLRTVGIEVPPLERFIRDAFDSLLYRMGILEHYISRDLVAFPDVKHPIDYYIGRMVEEQLQNEIQAYLVDYHFDRTKSFLMGRFEW